eukprot:3919870-Heterocapsa_arctica.AAC.1
MARHRRDRLRRQLAAAAAAAATRFAEAAMPEADTKAKIREYLDLTLPNCYIPDTEPPKLSEDQVVECAY